MNENIDLTKILKHCPLGWKFYSKAHGDVYFYGFNLSDTNSPIVFEHDGFLSHFTKNGHEFHSDKGECILVPSREQQDWSKFETPWYKHDKQRGELFDPHTFHLLDNVLVRDEVGLTWKIDLFSHLGNYDYYPYVCVGGNYNFCIPYNEETKHLLGSDEDEPEHYRFAREWQKNKQD